MTNSLKSNSGVWFESWELPDDALFNGIRIYLPSEYPKIHYCSKVWGSKVSYAQDAVKIIIL